MSQHHDPVHPDSEHLTAEVLADLGLGLLDPDSVTHAEHHLTHCAHCRQLRDDLGALTDTLGELPAPPMPDDVWNRLDEALAAQPVTTPAGAATVVPLHATRPRRRPGIGVVAGIAGIALVGAVVVSLVSSTNGTQVADGAGSGMEAADTTADRSGVPPAAYLASRTGTDYEPKQLDQQVISLVAERSAFTATASAPPMPTDAPTTLPSPSLDASPEVTASPSTLDSPLASLALTDGPRAAQACLESYLGATGVVPLAIDIGRWDGAPAAVIVLPGEEPDLVEVWVIDPDCAGAQDPLLYFATVSR